MTRARDPNLSEKLAAALLTMLRPDENGILVRIISHAEAKRLTTKQIISRFRFDHHPVRMVDREALSAAGIPDINHPSNLDPRVTADHDKKTAEIDLPQIAKQRRLVRAARIRAGEEPPRFKHKLRSRGFDKQHRPLRSRNTFQRRT
jgi:hypothetical protein